MAKKKSHHGEAKVDGGPAAEDSGAKKRGSFVTSGSALTEDAKERALVDRVVRLFATRPPMGGEVSLELARSEGDVDSSVVIDAHGVRFTLHLVVFELGENRSIRDLKEQVVWCAPRAALDDSMRFEEYLRGWFSALAELSLDGKTAERLMPHDLVRADVWQLKRPRTEAEFRASFLKKSRLGRLLRH